MSYSLYDVLKSNSGDQSDVAVGTAFSRSHNHFGPQAKRLERIVIEQTPAPQISPSVVHIDA